MTAHILGPILGTLDSMIQTAKLRTPGGVLNNEDMAGLYRRVGKIHGCTPDDVQRWHEQRDRLLAA